MCRMGGWMDGCCLLVAECPINMPVYLREGTAQTIVRAGKLRQKL